MVIPKLSKVFWGWLSCFLTFAIYPIIAACVLFVIGNVFGADFVVNGDSGFLVQVLSVPVEVVLCGALIYSLLKIPAMAHMVMSGVAHSDFGEFIAGFVVRAFV
jgi:hypothetical protein